MEYEAIKDLRQNDGVQFTSKFPGITVDEVYLVNKTSVGRLIINARGLGAYLADLHKLGAEFEKITWVKGEQ
jgi:hypothetical protein